MARLPQAENADWLVYRGWMMLIGSFAGAENADWLVGGGGEL